jgi:ABC-2 type transport system permease protein
VGSSPIISTNERKLYGLNQLVHVPLVGGSVQWSWVLNLIVWLAIWRFRIDTSRV